ncbi:amidohydrolase [Cryobacterium sp. CG_9.6]|uniref:amidohydrolase n=1 Tax=Cryobacterium sp. CG_9.6 TaxID=2760710 RepID=UPI002473C8B1|nr:amidohydrolase [Cryobacterium sp. CG_9.6]MDH6236096.1 putative amidohydrolase YtcJ [Cryobacterium sp. CG_9.6]
MTLVLRNGRLPGSELSYDVEISNTGTDKAVLRRMSRSTGALSSAQSTDLDGRWLVPGLWDNHVHFSQWAQNFSRLDLSDCGSAAETAALVAKHVSRVAPSNTIVGSGFRDALWADAPNRAVLDAASPSVPVVLVSGDLHCCWLNSAALVEHGFTDHPTGLLREDDCFRVVSAIGTVTDESMDAWAQTAAVNAAARGVVGIVDFEMDWNLDAWRRRIAGGSTFLRVEFGIYAAHLQRAIELGLRTGAVIAGTEGLLTVGPFKVLTDGSLNTRTALCVNEYPGLEDTPGSRGLSTVPPAELQSWMQRAVQAGIRPAVHAIGDLANSYALDAFDAVGCGGSIEHAQLLMSSDIERFAKLGIVASVQPEHAMDDRDVADRFWPGETGRAFPLASLQQAGVELAFGSDAPVAPLDPWAAIASAVGRTRGGRAPWHPEQSVSRAVALAASARGRSVVAEGDVADLAICESDPFTASVDELRRMPVAATLLNGRFTHNRL